MLNSGASHHFSYTKTNFFDFTVTEPRKVLIGKGSIRSFGYGTIRILTLKNNSVLPILLNNVLFTPELEGPNLFSTVQANFRGFTTVLANKVYIVLKSTNQVVAIQRIIVLTPESQDYKWKL